MAPNVKNCLMRIQWLPPNFGRKASIFASKASIFYSAHTFLTQIVTHCQKLLPSRQK